jgi:hypothetical protein
MINVTPERDQQLVREVKKHRVKIKPGAMHKRTGQSKWPILSDGMGCSADQIPDMKAYLQSQGVKAEFTPDGRAILESRAHRKAVGRALQIHDRNGGYGDP